MGGKISDNTDVFENILTKQWRKNPHPKRVRILTRLLKAMYDLNLGKRMKQKSLQNSICKLYCGNAAEDEAFAK